MSEQRTWRASSFCAAVLCVLVSIAGLAAIPAGSAAAAPRPAVGTPVGSTHGGKAGGAGHGGGHHGTSSVQAAALPSPAGTSTPASSDQTAGNSGKVPPGHARVSAASVNAHNKHSAATTTLPGGVLEVSSPPASVPAGPFAAPVALPAFVPSPGSLTAIPAATGRPQQQGTGPASPASRPGGTGAHHAAPAPAPLVAVGGLHEPMILSAGGWQGVSLRAATQLRVPIAFGFLVALFVIIQSLVDRRDPKVAAAPRRMHDESIGFE
jgi:hypothetical protein